MTFGDVVEHLRTGQRAYRDGWNGVRVDGVGSMYVEYRAGDGDLLPYLSLRTPAGTQVPWLATSTDIFGTDWRLLYPEVAT